MTAPEEPLTVHLLSGGRALCGKPGVPGEWGPGHRWVSAHDDGVGPRSAANCEACILCLEAPGWAPPDAEAPARAASESDHARYLGDGVYATFDGYHIWLTTGSHDRNEATNRIALEPAVFEALVKYQRGLFEAVGKEAGS